MAYIAALATAAKLSVKKFLDSEFSYADLFVAAYNRLYKYEEKGLPVYFTSMILMLTEDFVSSTFHFCLKNVESELIQSILSTDYDIYVGIGSGCSDGSFEVNKTLKEMGVPDEYIHGPIRLSFNDKNTFEEVEEVIDKIVEIYYKVKQNDTEN